MIYRDTKANAVFEGIKDGSVDEYDFLQWVLDKMDKASEEGYEKGGRECSCNDAYDRGYGDGYDDGLADA